VGSERPSFSAGAGGGRRRQGVERLRRVTQRAAGYSAGSGNAGESGPTHCSLQWPSWPRDVAAVISITTSTNGDFNCQLQLQHPHATHYTHTNGNGNGNLRQIPFLVFKLKFVVRCKLIFLYCALVAGQLHNLQFKTEENVLSGLQRAAVGSVNVTDSVGPLAPGPKCTWPLTEIASTSQYYRSAGRGCRYRGGS
jgi:hypothetical protein